LRHQFLTSSGSIVIEVEDLCIIASFKGNICKNIANFFLSKIPECVQEVGAEHWGYISCSQGAFGATKEAFDIFVEAFKLSVSLGAVCSAYVLKSPVAIDQMDKVRRAGGSTVPIQEVLFHDLESAKASIHATLEKYNLRK
jgi:hypothetical protein